jgi:hypothetical protein
MALQGNLRDFSAMEILQLVGSQKKSGCLVMEWNTEKAVVWTVEGRVVSTRQPGLTKTDPLAAFLIKVHRLSDEQFKGLLAIQKQSGRDLEDLLVNGRYVEAEDLAPLIERQVLDDLTRLVRWENGAYRFDPVARWPGEPVVMLSMEGIMIEAARRVDEQKRFVSVFRDPHRLLGVHDLPDPDVALSAEERELFGIIDGHHTVAEVVAAAPLTEYETYEALHRMLEAHWIEFTGRRDPGVVTPPTPVAPPRPASRRGPAWVREALVGGAVVALLVLTRLFAPTFHGAHVPDPASDVYAAALLRDLHQAVDLFARERGELPRNLDELVDDHWVEPNRLRVPGYTLDYRRGEGAAGYTLELKPRR